MMIITSPRYSYDLTTSPDFSRSFWTIGHFSTTENIRTRTVTLRTMTATRWENLVVGHGVGDPVMSCGLYGEMDQDQQRE